jgi:F-type H+-transporting ATPase subunit alpha
MKLTISNQFNYGSLTKAGSRISLRAKVNDSLLSGLRVVDSILPVGRGQRQLILGDRYTGKTSIFLSFLITSFRFSFLGSIDGFGTKRLLGLYIGMNQNLSKLSKLIDSLLIGSLLTCFSLLLSSHSSSSTLITFMIPLIGVTIAERLRDRSFESLVCFDDFSKHSKSYRQISLILAKIPSRDAFPADIFNIHSSLLERCGKLKYSMFGGSITGLPVIETINSDITEYIATNVISITDGQFYTNKRLFLEDCRPAIDSSLSVSRIGSNAQCKLMKVYSVGIKNLLTNYRNVNNFSLHQDIAFKFLGCALNVIFFQDHLIISPLETSLLILILVRMDYLV